MTSWTCNLREGAGHTLRAAIPVGKNTEITRFYSPGFEPLVFDVDGYRFGCAICEADWRTMTGADEPIDGMTLDQVIETRNRLRKDLAFEERRQAARTRYRDDGQ